MLLKQARMVSWKKWAAKHECEELKEGVWLEPIQAVLRSKTNEAWTDKHRYVMRKLVVEGRWVQKRLYDTGWSDEKKRQRLAHRRRHGEASAVPLSVTDGSQKPDPRGTGDMGEGQNVEGGLEVAKRNRVAPLEWEQLEKPPDSPEVGVSEAPKLVHASCGFPGPCHHRWLLAWSVRQLECVRVVSGAA